MNHLLVNPYLLADIYGCNTYGTGSYNTNDCSEVQDGGLLSNTGSPMFIGIGAGVLLIVLAVVILFMGRHKKK